MATSNSPYDRQSPASPVSSAQQHASQPHNIDWNEMSGLQVYEGPTITQHDRAGSGIEAVPRDEHGLIPAEESGSLMSSEAEKEAFIKDNNAPERRFDTSEKEPITYGKSGKGVAGAIPGAVSDNRPAEPFWKRHRSWLFGAGVLSILVILAAVLGGVLGSRANQKNVSDGDGQSGASEGSGPSAGGALSGTKNNTSRLRSTQGAWNGTGLAVIYQNKNLTQQTTGSGLVVYQDYQGDVKTARTNFDGAQQGTVSTEPPRSAGIEAAWGTGLAAVTVPIGDSLEKYAITYVCNNGTLCDVWADSNSPNGPWVAGNLSTFKFQVPLDFRPTMYMDRARCWDKTNTSYGVHLWAGSMDGKVSQYSYDVPSGTWDSQAYSIDGTFAFGGLFTDVKECQNTTLYTTDANGLLQYVFQDANPTQQWPLGGSPFGDAVKSNGRPGAGHPWSGIEAAFFDDVPNNSHEINIYYVINATASDNQTLPIDGPTLGMTWANATQFATSFWNDGDAVEYYPVSNAPAMPGTDMASYNLHYATGDRSAKIALWQDTGSTVRWRLHAGGNTFHNGTLIQ